MTKNSSNEILPTNQTSSLPCNLDMKLDSMSYHYHLNISIIAINTPFAVFAIFSNIVIIITVYKTRELRIPANILLCCLALTDLMVGLVTQPLFIAWRLMLHFSSTICSSGLLHSLYEAFLYLCTGGSFLCLAYLSTDRSIAVSRPLQYRANVTTNQTARNMAILWAIWIGFIVLRYVGIDENSNQIITSVIAGLLVIYLLVVQVVLMVYLKRNSIHSMHSGENGALIVYRRERRCAVTIVYIFLALLLFLLPAVLVQIITGFSSSNQSKTEMNFAISALLINSSANPLIYFWRSKDMRKAARRLFVGTKDSSERSNEISPAGNSGGNLRRSEEDIV